MAFPVSQIRTFPRWKSEGRLSTRPDIWRFQGSFRKPSGAMSVLGIRLLIKQSSQMIFWRQAWEISHRTVARTDSTYLTGWMLSCSAMALKQYSQERGGPATL